MPDRFGARLRQQRETQGIALAAIAKQTRIKESLLDALERDDLKHWPTGFYRRAFFRAYAAAIRLDPETAFREFQTAHPEPPEADVLSAIAATLGRGEGPSRSTAVRTAVGSAFSSISRLRRNASEEIEPPAEAPAPRIDSGPDLQELARICTELGCVTAVDAVQSLLHDAGRLLNATGLIVWAWNHRECQLQPTLYHGYPDAVVAQLPRVRRDDDNVTAAAFRSAETRVFTDNATGECALVLPLRTASGCVGVLAIELERHSEATPSRIAVAGVLAAQVAPLAGRLSQRAQVSLPYAVNAAVHTV